MDGGQAHDSHEITKTRKTLAEAGWRSDAPERKSRACFLAEHDRKIAEAIAIAEAAAADRRDIFTADALAWHCGSATVVRLRPPRFCTGTADHGWRSTR